MVLKSVLFFLVLLNWTVAVSPPEDDGIYEQLYDGLPEDVKTFIGQLTEDDLKLLSSLSNTFNVIFRENPSKFEMKAMALIQSKSVSLWTKIKTVIDSWRRTMANLSESARTFIEDSEEKLLAISDIDDWDAVGLIGIVRSILNAEEKLDQSVKDELKKWFPALIMVLEDKDIRQFFDDTKNMSADQLNKTLWNMN